MIMVRAALPPMLLAASLACSRGKTDRAPAPAPASAAAPAARARPGCPTPAGPAVPATANLIDDFGDGAGEPLEGRMRARAGFVVREQFQATPAAHFDPAPAVDRLCDGAAHIAGTAAGSGATFTIVFGSGGPVGGKPAPYYDARATKGLTFRAGLGDPAAARLYTVQVGLAGEKWSYTKDFFLDGTAWKRIDVRWSELTAAKQAPAFSAARLNQIVFPLVSGVPVDLYLDDIAFLR
jgi:hypothetical protein